MQRPDRQVFEQIITDLTLEISQIVEDVREAESELEQHSISEENTTRIFRNTSMMFGIIRVYEALHPADQYFDNYKQRYGPLHDTVQTSLDSLMSEVVKFQSTEFPYVL